MFSRKIILVFVLIFIAAFSAQAQNQGAYDSGIADYFNNLPKKYITASGDFMPPSNETGIIAAANGYAAYMSAPYDTNPDNQPFPIVEMAIFKSQKKTPLLVVSNLKSDPVCSEHETFFLRRTADNWTNWAEVEREVLPVISLKMFWDNPQSAARFKKIVEQDNSTTYHFEPPRNGTRMKVSLEICDYFLEVTPIGKVDELTKLMETKKALYLDWDKRNGKFTFAK